ncbi:unnamed protein product, partial [Prorocentrum cordatum]
VWPLPGLQRLRLPGPRLLRGGPGQVAGRLLAVGRRVHRRAERVDDYVLVEPKPLEYHKAGAGKSCSNWKEIGISPKMFKPTEKACASRCAQIRDCTGFAYQPRIPATPQSRSPSTAERAT